MKVLSLLFLASSTLWAQDFCRTDLMRNIQTINLSSTPNYFFKTSADGRFIYYITQNKNWALDTKTGKHTLLAGEADPVPSSDGKIMTTIARDPSHNNYWAFTVSEMKDGLPTQKSNLMGHIQGSYQSVGDEDLNGERPILYYDDISQTIKIFNLKKVGETYQTVRQTEILNGVAAKLRLPMMSPDGKYFSALNIDTNQTEIYQIEGNGKAKVIKKLPFAGGKAAFSYDSKSITFHVSRDIHQSWQQLPHESMYPGTLDSTTQIRNVFVYDIERGNVQQVTNNLSGNSYFPIFLADGRVAYIHKEHGSDQFSIQYSTIPKGPQRNYEAVVQCLGGENESKLEQMSQIWSNLCTQWSSMSDKNSASLGTILSMSMHDCLAMVEKSNDPSLGVVCQALNRADKNPVKVEPKKSPGEHILATRCLICHGEDKSWFAKNKASVMKSVNSKNPFTRMPRGGAPLTDQEKKDLKAYLDSF